MTGCCAFGCSNQSENYRMYRFPTDKSRRKLWEVKIKRKNWTPSDSSRICQEHFDENQFESKRADGKKKLKCSAVPTIFSFRKAVKLRKSPKKRGPSASTATPLHTWNSIPDHSYASRRDAESPQDSHSEGEPMDTDTQEDPGESVKQRLQRMEEKNRRLTDELRKTRRIGRALRKAKLKTEARFSALFSRDQLDAVSRGCMRGQHWSAATIKKALQLRFSCGASGYNMLLKQQYPLPSNRTLQRRMSHVSFQPGLLTQVFSYLRLKVEGLGPEERICCLTLDEMSITPSIDFDASSGSLMGNVTLPGHQGTATHALVFMLAGITSRWKQTVAYHFTGNSTDGSVMKDIVTDIIQEASAIGLRVVSVTTDMGSANRAMWKKCGVVCGRYSQTVHKMPHPQDPSQSVYFLADVPHLLKSFKSALVSGQTFTIPKEVAEENKLPSCQAGVEPILDLAEFQENLDLKLAPKLRPSLLTPTHFDKMKVCNATHVVSHDVSSAIRYLVNNEGRSEDNLTTAWLVETVSHWFELMSSRSPVLALSKLKIDKYEEAIAFLQSTIKLFQHIKIGAQGVWKPIQTGFILSTLSVIHLASELLDAGHSFLLTSRLSQDCLENLFSVVRMRKPVPSPLEFKYALKNISCAQFLKVARSGSYEQDDATFLADFLEHPSAVSTEMEGMPAITLTEVQSMAELSSAETASLYHLAGYCLHSVRKTQKHCAECLKEAVQEAGQETHHSSQLTLLKEFRSGALVQVSTKVFNMLMDAEFVFRQVEASLTTATNVKKEIMVLVEQRTKDVSLPVCHNLKEKILTKYINVRLHIFCQKITAQTKNKHSRKQSGGELGSKSMGMRKLADNLK